MHVAAYVSTSHFASRYKIARHVPVESEFHTSVRYRLYVSLQFSVTPQFVRHVILVSIVTLYCSHSIKLIYCGTDFLFVALPGVTGLAPGL